VAWSKEEATMLRIGMSMLFLLAMLAMLAACGRGGAPDGGAAGSSAAPGAAATGAVGPAVEAPVALEDVMQRDPRYLIGISYPPAAKAYPGLAKLLKAYADAARAEVMQAVSGLGDALPTAPYDLALDFSMLAETPDIVAVAARGSSYTGGAHGNPLVARFVWLPKRGEALTAARLVPVPDDWKPIADDVRDQLVAGLSARVDAAAPAPGDRAEMLRNGSRMIDEGTAPTASNFDQFEPLLGPDGRIQALRFVFPPYQVGPYSDGVQSADVPAAVLLPLVAPDYKALFEGG
jgi:hypothetical protein